MGKKGRSQKSVVAAKIAEGRPSYTFSQLLLANVVAWTVFLAIPFIAGKSFMGHGAEVYTFFSLLGLGFSTGSFLDFALNRM